MSSKKKNKAVSSRLILAAVLALVLGGFLFTSFTHAALDGLDWHLRSEMAMIAPDFEVFNEKEAKKVPEFVLQDRFGNPVELSQFEPFDLLLVNIWSSGCPACEREIPSLTELDRLLPSLGRVGLITITVDDSWDDVSSYFPQGTDLRVLFDPEQKVAKEILGTEKYPETFILDKERRIRARFDGEREWHSEPMLRYIASYL